MCHFFRCAINIALYFSDDKKFHLFSIAHISIPHIKFPKHFFSFMAALSHLRMLQRISLIKTRSSDWLISHFVRLIVKNEVLILQKKIWRRYGNFLTNLINWTRELRVFCANCEFKSITFAVYQNTKWHGNRVNNWTLSHANCSNWSRRKTENGSKSNVINCLFSIFVEVTLR